jgi:hypothetical protein
LTQKPSEEGRIWEWRAFGSIDRALTSRVTRFPIRAAIRDVVGEDIYFISSQNDQNVKLRFAAGQWLLKFKILLETKLFDGIPGAFELYDESARYTYLLPVGTRELRDAARLLSVSLTDDAVAKQTFGFAELSRVFSRATPSVVRVNVKKRRSQYAFDGGWIELAEASFPTKTVESISAHSMNLDTAQKIVTDLLPSDNLETMNYVQACRRWLG